MATKIIKQGIINDVHPVENYTDKGVMRRRQHIILHIPQWTDPLGEKRGRAEDWKIVALNEFIESNNVSTALIGKSVEVELVISSKKSLRANTHTPIFIVSVRLNRLIVISSHNQGDPNPDDDLIKQAIRDK